MSLNRRKFTDAFKSKVLREVDSGKSIAEVTRQYGLSKNSIYNWRSSAAAEAAMVSVPQHALTDLQNKVAHLERLVGHLTLENDILKKLDRSQGHKGSESSCK